MPRLLKTVNELDPLQTHELAHNTWGEEEIEAGIEVLRSGRYTMGARTKAFEKAFAEKFGVKHATMVNSGSSANLVGIGAFFFKKDRPLKKGDEVIVPAISWATTYHPLAQYGLKLKFVDVDLATLNLDVTQLEKALTKETRMVIAVSILGNPARLDVIKAFCDKHDLYFFEDNCESMGAKLGGKSCGTFGSVGTFSTFFSHHISTMEGGVIVTDDDEMNDIIRCLRAHGWTRDLSENTTLFEKKQDDFFEAYRFILPGYNVRPLEICAAIGIEQLKKLDGMVELRRKNAETFQRLFSKDNRFIIQKENGYSSWFCFTLILNPEWKGSPLDRKDLMARMKRAGIGFRMITGGNFLRHDVIKYYNYSVVGKTKNADLAHDKGFFVGNQPQGLTAQLEALHRILTEEND